MRFAHQEHAEPGLADAATHGQRQFPGKQHLVERQFATIIAACQRQLTVQGFGAHANAHGRDFKCTVKNRVPEQDISVEIPVVIVRCTSIVWLSGAEFSADALDKDGSVFFCKAVLPLLRRQIRPAVLKLLSGNKRHIAVVKRHTHQLRILAANRKLCITDAAHNAAYRLMQQMLIARFLGNDLFPVPLVHVDRMQIVKLFIPTNGIHVCIDALARMDVIAIQRHALPFGQGMYNLTLGFRCRNVEAHGAFNSVQVVVEAGAGIDEQRSRNPLQIKLCRK